MSQEEKKDEIFYNIFDSVFRAMLERMPQLMISLINEAFHTDYKPDDLKKQLKNEHKDITQGMDRITDSLLQIKDNYYHIECQKAYDKTMILRMFEYDAAIALQQAREQNQEDIFEINFPNSCVLYLTSKNSMKDGSELKVNFPDGHTHKYHVPFIRAQAYTKEEIFQKDLLVLLPYYILRYEKELRKPMDESRQQQLLLEYSSIEKHLRECTNPTTYSDLIDMMQRILDYEFQKNPELQERMRKVMSGEVLELYSERMIRQGKEEGIELGVLQGRAEAVNELVQSGIMDLERACEIIKISKEDYEKCEPLFQEKQQEEILPKRQVKKR